MCQQISQIHVGCKQVRTEPKTGVQNFLDRGVPRDPETETALEGDLNIYSKNNRSKNNCKQVDISFMGNVPRKAI